MIAARRDQETALEEASVRILGDLPRPVPPALAQGFLSAARAHASAGLALDYATSKQAQAEGQGQRVEQQFWGRVREVLAELPSRVDALTDASDVGLREHLGGLLVQAFARHLAAENWLRLGRAEDAAGGASARRGHPPRPARPPRGGG